jgi:hypothetical protein
LHLAYNEYLRLRNNLSHKENNYKEQKELLFKILENEKYILNSIVDLNSEIRNVINEYSRLTTQLSDNEFFVECCYIPSASKMLYEMLTGDKKENIPYEECIRILIIVNEMKITNIFVVYALMFYVLDQNNSHTIERSEFKFFYDLFKVNDTYCMYVAALGDIAELSYNTPHNVKKIWGRVAYYFSGFRQMMKAPKTYKVDLEVDGLPFIYETPLVC